MKTVSFARQVRDALSELTVNTKQPATAADLAQRLRLTDGPQRKRLINTLSEMSREGQIERVGKGLYRSARGKVKPLVCERMWSVLRMRKRVTIEDLMVMAGASRDYAREWLRALERQETVARQGEGHLANCTWALISDSIEMPQNDAKAERLRELRKNKKQQAMVQLLRSTAAGLHTMSQGLQEATNTIIRGLQDAANTMENDDE